MEILKKEGTILPLMLTIYTAPSCSSCRKAKAYLKNRNIPFVEKNIFVNTITEGDLRKILSKTENGSDDIISTRSKILKTKKINLDNLTVKQFCEFVRENPSVLKRPIMFDGNKLQVGYNSDEISVFLPRDKKDENHYSEKDLDFCFRN